VERQDFVQAHTCVQDDQSRNVSAPVRSCSSAGTRARPGRAQV
jgi:hypothetical protein